MSSSQLEIPLRLYKIVLRIRLVEETIAKEYPKQEMRCPVHLCIGQEAVSAGLALALDDTDALLGTHRSHGPYIARGGDVRAMFAEIYGKATGCCSGRGGSMHLIAQDKGFWGSVPIVGSTIPIATGAAFAFAYQEKNAVAAVLFGEGATEEGVFHESIQYAHLKNLPIIYVCEDNGFAVNTPYQERRPKDMNITGIVKAHGLRTFEGNGNDAIFVYEACKEAVLHARAGLGPSFLYFETYRWVEHCGPYDDHHLPCRSLADFENWKKLCPVATLKTHLLAHGVASEILETMEKTENTRIQHALSQAQNDPFPSAESASLYVYADQGSASCAH